MRPLSGRGSLTSEQSLFLDACPQLLCLSGSCTCASGVLESIATLRAVACDKQKNERKEYNMKLKARKGHTAERPEGNNEQQEEHKGIGQATTHNRYCTSKIMKAAFQNPQHCPSLKSLSITILLSVFFHAEAKPGQAKPAGLSTVQIILQIIALAVRASTFTYVHHT